MELYPPESGRGLIHKLYRSLRASELNLIETVPAFDCIAFEFENEVDDTTITLLQELNLDEVYKPKEWKLEVCFDLGLDMKYLERHSGLDRLQIVHILQSNPLTVAACGFLPGFIYLDGLDPRFHMPRRKVPRPKVAEGYFAIAGKQAGLYGVESPGGWNLIGKSPHQHFNPSENPPMPFEPGDLVHLEEISQADYDRKKNS